MTDFGRARTWIQENVKPSKYLTQEEYFAAVLKQPGFDTLKTVGKNNLIAGVDSDTKDAFLFKSQQDLDSYIAKKDAEYKAQREALERLRMAKNQEDVISAVKVTDPELAKGKAFVKPVTKAEPKGIVQRVVSKVGSFLRGLFGGKR